MESWIVYQKSTKHVRKSIFNLIIIFGNLEQLFRLKLDAKQESFRFLVDANKISERMWPFYLKYVLCGFLGILAANSLATVLIQRKNQEDFDATPLFHAYKLVYVKYEFDSIEY